MIDYIILSVWLVWMILGVIWFPDTVARGYEWYFTTVMHIDPLPSLRKDA
jgi:hypothetical protein